MTITSTTPTFRHSPTVTLGRIVWRLIDAVAELQTRISIRQSIGRLSDEKLQDIGMIRHDVDTACSGQLSQSAVSKLTAITGRRAGNW